MLPPWRYAMSGAHQGTSGQEGALQDSFLCLDSSKLKRCRHFPQSEPRWQRRATLPRPQQPAPKNINVWSLVKDVVGKGDLSKIATPVQLLEPLSELQQRCEDLEYAELLDQASSDCPNVSR